MASTWLMAMLRDDPGELRRLILASYAANVGNTSAVARDLVVVKQRLLEAIKELGISPEIEAIRERKRNRFRAPL